MIDLDNLIEQLKQMYSIKVVFDVPEYIKFHNELTQFIYENHFENTSEWQVISKNLVYKSNQYMTKQEADVILVQLDLLKRKLLSTEYKIKWEYIHQRITAVSKKLFKEENYSQASECAFKEIASRVRKFFKIVAPSKQEPNGDFPLMTTMFSEQNPMIKICDLSEVTGQNIQRGFMHMLAGAMSALRNPDAHSNDIRISQDDCIRRLMFASMLMFKIDEAVSYSKIKEV